MTETEILEAMLSRARSASLDDRVRGLTFALEQIKHAAAQARTLAAETEARIAAQAEVDNLRHSQDHKWVDRAENAERTLAVRDAQLSQVEHRAFRQAEMLAAVQALTETGDWNIPVSKLRQILYGGDK